MNLMFNESAYLDPDFFRNLFIILVVLGLHCCVGFSLAVESRGPFSSCGV